MVKHHGHRPLGGGPPHQDVAQRTEGLSGRQLAKLVLAFQSAVFGSGTTRLTQAFLAIGAGDGEGDGYL